MGAESGRHALPAWIRAAIFVMGVILLLWLPIEDTSERTPVLLAALTSVVLAAAYLARLPFEPCDRVFRRFLPAGLLAGIAVSPLAAFLMVFKSGLHGHGFPDYSSTQIVDVLARTPVWALAGTLTALGGGLWQWVRCD